MSNQTSRRVFLKNSAVAAAAVAALGACDTGAQDKPATKGPPTGGTMGPHDTGTQAANGAVALSNAVKMDAMHEAGIKAFPAKTESKGNQILKPRMDRDVKVFDLTCQEVQWEIEVGRRVKACIAPIPGPGHSIAISCRAPNPSTACSAWSLR